MQLSLSSKGRLRGFAHRGCNINYKPNFYIAVLMHNLSGYDSHISYQICLDMIHILKQLSNNVISKMNIIPMNNQKMLTLE